jgi:Mrp family chromosome partitioning ATPase
MTDEKTTQTLTLNDPAREPAAQLCVNLYAHTTGPGPAKLAITSSNAGEGKSSLALALGLQMVEILNSPVLVVEANLRKPGLGKLVRLPKDAPGFADLLGGADADSLICKLGPEAPDILPAGKIGADQISRLMNREKVEKAFTDLSRRYPYLVIEAPAVNLYPEAMLILGAADGVILTIKAGVTSRETVSLASKKIEAVHGKFLGLVLNQKQFPLPEWLYRRL